MRVAITVLAIGLACGVAAARDEDGRLATVLSPNNVQPAVVLPGTTIPVLMRKDAVLTIESADGRYALESKTARPERGVWRMEAAVPKDAAPGAYSLVARGPGVDDVVHRAVFVLESAPDNYRVALVTHLRAGDPAGSDSRLFRIVDEINREKPDLILVAGDLTAGGTAHQLGVALDVLNSCEAPTIAAPSATDNRLDLAEAYFGSSPAAIPFGRDAYLVGPLAATYDEGIAARLHRERRLVRSARWTIGVAARFPRDDLRTALTLLLDDPLDFLIDVRDERADDYRSPWGRTRIFPAGPGRAEVAWFTVGMRGMERAANDAP